LNRLNVAALNHGAESKATSEPQSQLDQPLPVGLPVNHAMIQDMERPPANGVLVRRDGTAEPKLVFVPSGVDQPGVTLIPTVGYYRPHVRASRAGRNGRGAGSTGPSDVDLVLYGPARGCNNLSTFYDHVLIKTRL